MTTPRPDLPAEARLREAARSYRLLAAQLRRANPGRRATSRWAELDLAPDGRLLALRVVSSGLAGSELAKHFTALHAAAGRETADAGPESSAGTGSSQGPQSSEGIVVADLPAQTDQPAAGLGTRRFRLPPGVDRQADPAVMMQQLRDHLRSRSSNAERASEQIAGLVGHGSSAQGRVSLAINSAGQLHEISLSSWTAELPLTELNDVLAEALALAGADLQHQIDTVLDQSGASR